MKKDKVIKKLKEKIKKKTKNINSYLKQVEKSSDYGIAVNSNAIEIICNILGIKHVVDMDGLYVAGENCSRKMFTNSEIREIASKNKWPINTGCSCEWTEISGHMHVNDSGFFTPNHPITTSTATLIGGYGTAKETFSVEDDDRMEEEDGK